MVPDVHRPESVTATVTIRVLVGRNPLFGKTRSRLKVCFVSPYIYPLFNPEIKTMFGGIEVRIYQIVTEMAKRSNFEVCVIVADHGQAHREIRDGVELISWTNQPMFGIPAPRGPELARTVTTAQEIDKNVNGDQNREIIPDSQNSSLCAQTIYSKLKSFMRYFRGFYKSNIPWRIRILIHAFLVGLRASIINFIMGSRTSLNILRESTASSLTIARKAFNEINDEPVFPDAVAIFEEVNADIYVVPGNNWIAARVATYCSKRRRVYIMVIGSDKDLLPEIKDNPSGFDVFTTPHTIKSYTINHADTIVVQSENQVELAGYFGVSPVLIRNPVNLDRLFPKIGNTNHILWVGNTRESVKRPSLMLEVARRLSQFRFTMIVTIVDQDDFDQLMRAAMDLPNMTVLTSIPFSEVEKYFASSKVFVNTSNFEGFPNTFLQAGKYAVPVASLKVDPNHIFTQYHCGLLCDDNLDVLIENILKLMCDPQFYEPYSQNIMDYVTRFHDKDLVISQYEKVFRKVARRKQSLFGKLNW